MSTAQGEAASGRLQIDVCESCQHRPSKPMRPRGPHEGLGQNWTMLSVGPLKNTESQCLLL